MSDVIEDLKKFNWQKIVDYGNSLSEFNDAQWRFLKGLIAELCVEFYSNLVYVGENHKDYDWPMHKKSVELKSQLSDRMYCKNGKLKKNYEIKLNNSNGTNNQKTLPPEHVADYLIVLRNDGAFVIDKNIVLTYAAKQGDGFNLKIPNTVITEISGRIKQQTAYNNNLKTLILKAIRDDISSL